MTDFFRGRRLMERVVLCPFVCVGEMQVEQSIIGPKNVAKQALLGKLGLGLIILDSSTSSTTYKEEPINQPWPETSPLTTSIPPSKLPPILSHRPHNDKITTTEP